jgi:hypothetical protein
MSTRQQPTRLVQPMLYKSRTDATGSDDTRGLRDLFEPGAHPA